MSDSFDFERYWLDKFAACVEEACGAELRAKIMLGSDGLTEQSDRRQVIQWSRQAVELLEARCDGSTRREIMTGCACQYPVEQLQKARKAYEDTGDIERARAVLQRQFEEFLRHDLDLDERQAAFVLAQGWGLAGVLRGGEIIATKIPKSGFLAAYLEETDPEARRQMCCHCPRVRDALKLGESLPAIYCYCGAGFYKAIWEEILQRPVRVEVIESVLQGGDACVVKVHVGDAPPAASD